MSMCMRTCSSVWLLYGDLSGQACFGDRGAGAQALVETPQEHRETQNHHLHKNKHQHRLNLNIAMLLFAFAFVFLPLILTHKCAHKRAHKRTHTSIIWAEELSVQQGGDRGGAGSSHHEACGGLSARHPAGPRDLSCHHRLQRVQLLQKRPERPFT